MLIHANVHDLAFRKAHNLLNNVFPRTKEDLLKECKPPRQPYNDWHARYWSACDYVFEDEGLYIRVKFTGGGDVYPPERIEETKATVLEEIRKCRIDQYSSLEKHPVSFTLIPAQVAEFQTLRDSFVNIERIIG